MSALEDSRGLELRERENAVRCTPRDVQALHTMAPTALNGCDAVVQFEGGTSLPAPRFSGVTREARRSSSMFRPQTQGQGQARYSSGVQPFRLNSQAEIAE